MTDLYIQSISIDWEKIDPGSYLRKIPAIVSLSRMEFTRPVTFFAGENGSGKSTLLEAIAAAGGFNPEGGSRNYRFSTHDSHSELWQAVRLTRGWRRARWGYFLRAESFYNAATQEEQYADFRHPSRKYHEKSHGESFLCVLLDQMEPGGLYLLDEPEAALSAQSQLALLMMLHRHSQAGAQFLVATHSPILLGLPEAEILSFDGGKIRPVRYEETSSYQITRRFMADREAWLRQLLAESEEQP